MTSGSSADGSSSKSRCGWSTRWEGARKYSRHPEIVPTNSAVDPVGVGRYRSPPAALLPCLIARRVFTMAAAGCSMIRRAAGRRSRAERCCVRPCSGGAPLRGRTAAGRARFMAADLQRGGVICRRGRSRACRRPGFECCSEVPAGPGIPGAALQRCLCAASQRGVRPAWARS